MIFLPTGKMVLVCLLLGCGGDSREVSCHVTNVDQTLVTRDPRPSRPRCGHYFYIHSD